MSLLLESLYTNEKGCYTKRELEYLSLSLGFDVGLFERVKRKLSCVKQKYSDEEVSSWLERNLLDEDLQYVFNRHSAKYNVKVFKKAMHYLRYRRLAFFEIACGRRIFELMSVDEPLGLPMNVETFTVTLRLCSRIIPPLRLQHIFQSMRRSLDDSGRMKLYEFIDVLAYSQDLSSAVKSMKISKDVTETDYEHLLRCLNEEYKTALRRPLVKIPTKKAPTGTLRQRNHYINQVKLKYREECDQRLTPTLLSSKTMLLHARAGYNVISSEKGIATLSRLTNYPSRPQSKSGTTSNCPTSCKSLPTMHL